MISIHNSCLAMSITTLEEGILDINVKLNLTMTPSGFLKHGQEFEFSEIGYFKTRPDCFMQDLTIVCWFDMAGGWY